MQTPSAVQLAAAKRRLSVICSPQTPNMELPDIETASPLQTPSAIQLAAAKRRLSAILADPAMRLPDLAAELNSLAGGARLVLWGWNFLSLFVHSVVVPMACRARWAAMHC